MESTEQAPKKRKLAPRRDTSSRGGSDKAASAVNSLVGGMPSVALEFKIKEAKMFAVFQAQQEACLAKSDYTGSQPPSTFLSGENNPAPGGTYKVNETNASDKKPRIEYPTWVMDILNTPINILMQEHPEVVQTVERSDARVLAMAVKLLPLSLLYLGIEAHLKSIKTDGFNKPQETDKKQSSLGGGSNLVDNPGNTEKRLLFEAVEKYFASELKVMQQQGFMDTVKNIKALLESGDDVQKAIEKLKEKPN